MQETVGVAVNVTTPGMREAMTAARELGAETRRAADGVPGAETAGTRGIAGGASLRGLARELQTTERLFGALNVQIQQLLRTLNQPGSGGGVPGARPLAVPAGAGPRLAAPGGGAGGGAGSGGGGGVGNLLAGAIGVIALDVGYGIISEVRRITSIPNMARTSRSYEESVFRATLAGGGGTDRYGMLRDRALEPGSFVHPDQQMEMLERAQRFGVPMRRPGRLGELGEAALGSAQAGGQFAVSSYLTLRNDKAVEVLTDMRNLQKTSGRDIGEQVQLYQSMLGLLKQGGGPGRRTDEEIARLRGTQRLLEGLPGEVGQGEGGQRIAQAIMGKPQNDWLTVQAYLMQGGNLSSDKGRLEYLKFAQDPSRRVGGVLAAATAVEPDPTRRALLLAYQEGLTGTQAENVSQGRTTMADVRREEAAARRGLRSGGGPGPGAGLEGTTGGRGVMTEANVQRWLRDHPHMADALIGIGETTVDHPVAMGLGATAASVLGLGTALRVGRSFLGGGGGRSTASRMVGRLGGLGRGLGPAAAGVGDAYEAATGEGWQRFLPLIGGAIGAGAGAIGGFGFGAGPGFMGGSALGSGLEMLLGGGGTRAKMKQATAATDGVADPTIGGWQRDEVSEHLSLLRELVEKGAAPGDDRREAAVAPATEQPGALALPKDARALSAHRTAARIDPRDPMFDEAAQRAGIDPALLRAVIKHESGFDPNAVSPTQASGLGQFTKRTWRAMRPGHSLDERFDPKEAAGASADLLRQELDFFGGDRSRASMAYFHGRSKAQHPGSEERAYAAGVEREYRVMVDLTPEARELLVARPTDDAHDAMVTHRRRG